MNRGRKRARLAQVVLLALICLELLAMSVSSEDLILRRAAGEIHLVAPRLHFLSGKSLQRLHDGLTVPFDFQFTISAGSKTNVVGQFVERFLVSYDVWEEKFKVVGMGSVHRYGSHLTQNGAEAWCLENLYISSAAVPSEKPLWARLEVRSVDAKEQASIFTDPGINISTLIGIFSQRPRPQQDHWILESTPFHLADLKP